ncbi:hypothetical protein [Sphingobacterium corticibacter]|uniref:Uncharacterized protein n=1 Tax=Sphingobacterium corticibacter TaxID=2171749 RepID=A0A2T8HGL9_9SPHI|nr:hypothetical protein [Sphingobacterium corticibacter]PVH24543.1 hypothetical protein DC487_13490 [Sphingobacterium corticibacter]
MKLFVFICITSIVIIASCINDKSAATKDSKDNSYVNELSEFAYQGDNSSLRKAVDILKKEYGIGDLGFEDINILNVKNRQDSTFFDFSIVEPRFFELHSKDYSAASIGFLTLDSVEIIVFDQVGIFEKMNISKEIHFGVQEHEYAMVYEPLLFRFYLKHNGQLNFVEEEWLDYGRKK